MNRMPILILICLSMVGIAAAQSVTIPAFKDQYTAYLKELESGQLEIDYRKFRESLLESEQFLVMEANTVELEKQKLELRKLIWSDKDYEKAIVLAGKILSLDYTAMEAHYLLTQVFSATGDSTRLAKHRTILTGLVDSILDHGDGQTCATGWQVIKVEEEYFILRVLQLQPLGQSVFREDGAVCDKLEVQTKEGTTLHYFFDVRKVFEAYDRKMKKS